MLALIIVVCIVSITTLGKNSNNTFSNVAAKLIPGGGSPKLQPGPPIFYFIDAPSVLFSSLVEVL